MSPKMPGLNDLGHPNTTGKEVISMANKQTPKKPTTGSTTPPAAQTPKPKDKPKK